jgi:hypothetical protein
MRSTYLCTLALLTVACSMEAPEGTGSGLHGGGTDSGTAGDGSGMPQAGTQPVGTAGSTSNGGTSPSGGSTSTAGATAGGSDATAGSSAAAGSSATGGSGATAGSSGVAGAGGTMGMDNTDVAKPLDGLRIDDPCSGVASTNPGSTCNHVMNPFHAKTDVTIGGMSGVTYDVTLRIRGVVEPTKVNGGTRPDTSTTMINGKTYRKQPYTVGGTPGDATYQPWLFSVSNPSQNYYFNDYGLTEHTTFLLDYEVTIPMAGGAKATLDVADGNDHEIDNYAKLVNDGIPGSMNLGQYLQINVVSVKPH